MKMILAAAVAAALAAITPGAPLLAQQEYKPVPKDSVRVFVPGCTRGSMFTAGPRAEDQVGRSNIPEGMHMRMSGPKKMLSDIKAHEGTMIEVTGLIKKGQRGPDGVGIGDGVRITPSPSPGSSGSPAGDPFSSQIVIDVEGWRQVTGNCPSN